MAKGKKKDKKKAKAKEKAAKIGLAPQAKAKKKEKKPSKREAAKVQGATVSAPKETSKATPAASSAGAKHATTAKLESFEMPAEETLFNLANLFKIFSDPTRLKILFSLVEGPRCVADIAAAAGVTQGATSHQLRSMKQEDLVSFVRDGKQVFYSLSDNRVQTLLAQGLSYIDE